MKGILFNQLENYIVENYGDAAYQTIIKNCRLETTNPFVGPGTYPDSDLMKIIQSASETLKINPDDLVRNFGRFVFPKLASKFSTFIEKQKNAKGFLLTIESIIHVEVHKMYEKAYTPTFEYLNDTEGKLTIRYRSKRKLYVLMEGIIMGVADYFCCSIGQEVIIHKVNEEEVGDFHLTFH